MPLPLSDKDVERLGRLFAGAVAEAVNEQSVDGDIAGFVIPIIYAGIFIEKTGVTPAVFQITFDVTAKAWKVSKVPGQVERIEQH